MKAIVTILGVILIVVAAVDLLVPETRCRASFRGMRPA